MPDYRENPNGWNTYLDVDFTKASTQTFSTNTTYLISGKRWSKLNSSSDITSTTISSSTGLQFKTSGSINWLNNTRSFSAMFISLNEIIPQFNASTGIRLWCYDVATSSMSIGDSCKIVLYATGTDFMFGVTNITGSLFLQTQVTKNDTTTSVTTGSTYGSTNNVRMLEVSDILTHKVKTFYGTYSSGFPTINSMSLHTVSDIGTSTNRLVDGIGALTMSNWSAGVVVGSTGSMSSSLFTIGRIRVDLLRNY